ncbi:MAG: PBP1A family penicillin-binding protein [Candidatus Latescibacterota bacterium]
MSAWRRPMALGAGLLLLAAAVLLGGAWWWLRQAVARLPRLPDDPAELAIRPGTEVYAATGERIYTFNQTRQWVSLEQVPPHVVQALLATEDRAFYTHAGVDLEAVAGALWANVRGGYGSRGASTLTQQLVKRLFFSPEKSLRRKLSEALLALQLEALYARQYPGRVRQGGPERPAHKDRLLELYLNTVFYGANAYGITDAADTYFGVRPENLSVPQAALLVGLINAPSAYNPLQRPERATQRLRHVLRRMAESGHLTRRQLEGLAAVQAANLVDPQRRPLNPAPFWMEAVKAEVGRRWGSEVLRYGSLRIHTTLNLGLQRAAEAAVTRGLDELDERLGFAPYAQAPPAERPGYVQAALVCLTPATGQVRAMVGGRDIQVSYYNRALAARRQPRSGFKPVVYLTALQAGVISPVSLFVDEPRQYQVEGRAWAPRNFGEQYLGLTTAAWALIHSANSTAVQLTALAGPDRVVRQARALGFDGEVGPHPSIALGVDEVTVLEMASAYGALANAGLLAEPTLVDSVVDAEGRRLFAHAPAVRQAAAPDAAYQVLQLLRQAVERGTGRVVRRLGFDRPVAGKTGTTNENTDAWFTGCTPDLATSVWVGFDDRRQHRLVDRAGVQITGSNGAAPMWTQFMRQATRSLPRRDFSRPHGVRLAAVDPQTGLDISELPEEVRRDTLRPAPITLALREGERPNRADEVLAFVRQADYPVPDPLAPLVRLYRTFPMDPVVPADLSLSGSLTRPQFPTLPARPAVTPDSAASRRARDDSGVPHLREF